MLTTQSDLQILNTPSGAGGPPPCALTCSGIGMWNGTGTIWEFGWDDSRNFPGKAFMRVDIERCNFVSLPVITTSVITEDESPALCPLLTQKFLQKNKFFVYTFENITYAEMESYECNVHWSAFGYVC
jgi:hypothetical protein